MHKFFAFIAVAAVIVACSGDETAETTGTSDTATGSIAVETSAPSADADNQDDRDTDGTDVPATVSTAAPSTSEAPASTATQAPSTTETPSTTRAPSTTRRATTTRPGLKVEDNQPTLPPEEAGHYDHDHGDEETPELTEDGGPPVGATQNIGGGEYEVTYSGIKGQDDQRCPNPTDGSTYNARCVCRVNVNKPELGERCSWQG